jgi:glycosyltransferase involved in cell wall biosynthesis
MIVPAMPSDRDQGLAMRAGFFLDAYSRRFDVDLVVAPVAGSAAMSPFALSRARRIEVLGVDRPESYYALVSAVRDPLARIEAFRRYGRPSLNAFIAPLTRMLRHLAAENYEVLHVFRLYMAELATPWIRNGHARPLAVLDCDEDDAMSYRRIAGMERRRGNWEAAMWAKAEAEAFARFAADWLPKFDLVFAASHSETRSLSVFGVRAMTVPNVAAARPVRPRRRGGRCYSIVFVGTMGYAPNVDAVLWFISRVWRRLERALAHRVRLTIVGGGVGPDIMRLKSQRGIKITGAVGDVGAYYRGADLAIAPLRAGGGTRIKIIEAAAHGIPVVATGFGAEGTAFRHGADLLIANHEAGFLRACLLLARNRPLAARLASRARVKVMRGYSPDDWRAFVADTLAGHKVKS